MAETSLQEREHERKFTRYLSFLDNAIGTRELCLAFLKYRVAAGDLTLDNQPVFERLSDGKLGFLELSREQLASGLSDADRRDMAALPSETVYLFALTHDQGRAWRGVIIGSLVDLPY